MMIMMMMMMMMMMIRLTDFERQSTVPRSTTPGPAGSSEVRDGSRRTAGSSLRRSVKGHGALLAALLEGA